ncbi:MAG: glycosyl hydrolase family 28-related protein [Opitutales bacterium]
MVRLASFFLTNLLLAGPLSAAAAAAGSESGVGWWRFEQQGLTNNGHLPNRYRDDGLAGLSAEAGRLVTAVTASPGPWIYDPLRGSSGQNRAAVRFGPEGEAEAEGAAPYFRAPIKTLAGDEPFTLEGFFKPHRKTEGPWIAGFDADGRQAWAVTTSRGGHRHRWFGYQAGNGRPTHGGFYKGPSMLFDEPPWRHVALVWDPAAGKLSFYVQYQLWSEWEIDPATFPETVEVRIGGSEGESGYRGLIDEVRLVGRALHPADFLRALPQPVENVDFRSPNRTLPLDAGIIDLRLHYGAVGDGQADDTEAFRRAFRDYENKVPNGFFTIYVPPGTYRVTDVVRFRRFMALDGAGPDKTIIRLDDQAPGYQDPDEPKAVLGTGYSAFRKWKNGVGNAIQNYIVGLTVETGSGNPGAVGIDYISNNEGTVRDVVVRSGDGTGYIGLSCIRPWPGPSFVKNVRVEGFDYGIAIGSLEYSMTFEDIHLEGQNKAGFLNQSNIVGIRRLTSVNAVPAIESRGSRSLMTVLDSDLTGGADDQAAIFSQGALYLRDIRTGGYGTALRKAVPAEFAGRKVASWETETLPGPVIDEYIGDTVYQGFGDAKRPLNLPVEDPPDVPWGDPETDWVSVEQFEDKVEWVDRRRDVGDWAEAIEAALASGAGTVYLPANRRIHIGRSIHVRQPGPTRLFGLHSSIKRLDTMPEDEPGLVFASDEADALFLVRGLSIDAGVHHDSPGTMIFRHGNLVPFTNSGRAGKLFLEDVGRSGYTFSAPLKIWARQINPELRDRTAAAIYSHGATFWALGFKTEYDSGKLWADSGARTEIYAAFIYPVVPDIPRDLPIFKNIDSDLSVQFGTSVYSANHFLQVLERKDDEERSFTVRDFRYFGPRGRADLYVGRARQNP